MNRPEPVTDAENTARRSTIVFSSMVFEDPPGITSPLSWFGTRTESEVDTATLTTASDWNGLSSVSCAEFPRRVSIAGKYASSDGREEQTSSSQSPADDNWWLTVAPPE